MKSTWQLQEAKNRLSEVVEQAMTRGAQVITKHGRPVVVVVSTQEYSKLTGSKPRKKLVEIFRQCPDPEFTIQKSRGRVRTIDLE